MQDKNKEYRWTELFSNIFWDFEEIYRLEEWALVQAFPSSFNKYESRPQLILVHLNPNCILPEVSKGIRTSNDSCLHCNTKCPSKYVKMFKLLEGRTNP